MKVCGQICFTKSVCDYFLPLHTHAFLTSFFYIFYIENGLKIIDKMSTSELKVVIAQVSGRESFRKFTRKDIHTMAKKLGVQLQGNMYRSDVLMQLCKQLYENSYFNIYVDGHIRVNKTFVL